MTNFSQSYEETVSLCREIIQLRRSGRARCHIAELQPPLDGFSEGLKATFSTDMTAVLDAFAVEQDLLPLGHAWDEIAEETAQGVMVRMLYQDLAYRTEIMSEKQAGNLVARFIAICGQSTPEQRHWFYTNGKAVDGGIHLVDCRVVGQ
jgi:hypothetical protein